MGTAHEFTARIRSFAECQRLNQVSKECGQVVVIDRNGNQANAKSLLSLMSLDYSASVRIVASTFSSTTAIIFSLILTGVFLHVYLQCLQKDFS